MGLSQRLGWIGVDVGTHTVKLAQAVREGAGVRLHRAAVIQRSSVVEWRRRLGDGATDSPPPRKFGPRRSAGGFTGRDAVCSLPMNMCQLRGLNVPPGTDQERRTISADELAEEWAEQKAAMEFDFWEMEPGPADKNTDAFNVSILAVSRPWIAQLWSRLPAERTELLGRGWRSADDGASGGAGGRT